MVAITRVSVARPRWRSEGRSVLGPDEDTFTLAAAALEPIASDGATPTRPVHLDLVGAFPAVAEWGLPALLGSGAKLSRSPSFADAIERHRNLSQGERAIVVEVDEGAVADRRRGPVALATVLEAQRGWDLMDGEGEGATAAPPLPTLEALESLRDAPTGTPGLLAVGRGYRVQKLQPAQWTEDEPPREPPTIDPTALRRLSEISLDRVSEGAYIPRARYIEGIPSRWRLLADRCPSCQSLTFPAIGACRGCEKSVGLRSEPLPRDGGQVVALTTIGRGGQPTEFDPLVEAVGTYSVAIVEFAPGCRGTFSVTDALSGSISIGDRVGTRLRRLYPMEGEWRYGRKVVPVSRPSS